MAAGKLQLLEHGCGAAVGEDIAGQQEDGQAVDGGDGGSGDHVRRAGADGAGARVGAHTLAGFCEGDGGVDHGLFVLGLKKRELRSAEFLEGLAETGDVAVAEDTEDAVDEAMLGAVAADVLLLEKFDQRGGHAEGNGFNHGDFGEEGRAASRSSAGDQESTCAWGRT